MSSLSSITFSNFIWLNEPKEWSIKNDILDVKTDLNTDFWQDTWYNFSHNSGHVFALEIKEDFTLEICVEAEFTTLYDQAGLMLYVDERHWLKAGIEYNDGQPMIGSVLTNQVSDWATGVFTGDPRKFWIKLSKVGEVVCVKYSNDKMIWNLLRLAPFVKVDQYFVGPMCCTPKREGLSIKFSEMSLTTPVEDFLHSD